MLAAMQALDEAIRSCLDGVRKVVPWAEVQLLFASIVHGSRMSDAKDQQQLEMMVQQIVHSGIASQPKLHLAPVPQYFVPNKTTLQDLEVSHACCWYGHHQLGLLLQECIC